MTTHLWASPPFTHTNNTDTSGLAQSLPGRNPGRGRCAPRRQSLLRSCLAARSFPRRLPAYALSAVGTPFPPIRLTPKRLDSPPRAPLRNLESVHLAKPHHAGGGGGKECAARHERSNDWPQGGAAPITRKKCASYFSRHERSNDWPQGGAAPITRSNLE